MEYGSLFPIKANSVHEGKYDYSLVKYINNKTKVSIICPKHGEFKQTPKGHLNGQGCPTCCNEAKTFTTDIFKEKAHSIHGDKYDYSLVKYTNIDTKVVIICKLHGEFSQTPYKHIKGQGCPLCGNISKANSQSNDDTWFKEKAYNIHGDRYDYSLVKYTNIDTKVVIICKTHGEFYQTPYKHLSGQGCPICAKEVRGFKRKFTLGIPTKLYVLKLTNGLFKIGITRNPLTTRFSKTELALIDEIVYEFIDNGEGLAWDIEKKILSKLYDYKYKGPPILETGNTELLLINPLEEVERLVDMPL